MFVYTMSSLLVRDIYYKRLGSRYELGNFNLTKGFVTDLKPLV